MNRRDFCKTAAAVSAVAMFSPNIFAAEEPKVLSVAEAIAQVTKGKSAQKGTVVLTAPSIAENGLVVPLKVELDIAITDARFPKKLYLIAPANPVARICSISFSKKNGKAYFTTRCKLAKSQDVIALVELGDGTFVYDTKMVKVTIGGCG